jgi:hypothetical protein
LELLGSSPRTSRTPQSDCGTDHGILHPSPLIELATRLAPYSARRASIGIGGGELPPLPSHTTRHAGPHRAVRSVEVHSAIWRFERSSTRSIRSSLPWRAGPLAAGARSTPSKSFESATRSSRSGTSSKVICRILAPRLVGRAPLRSVLRRCRHRLLRPLLTSRSTACTASPFQA